MPESIPQFSADELQSFSEKSYAKIAYAVLRKFLEGEVENDTLYAMTQEAYHFPVPLERVVDRRYVMRLDQGPTASFKDFAARMMARLMHYFLKLKKQELLILTATSGDTGSAIANAVYGLENIKLVVLFPEREVSDRQRKLMTTLVKNIRTIAVRGKFDDCQALVKQAFADPELAALNLSSANSINIGRLLPQSVYYFYAVSRLRIAAETQVIFSVPSGNFGNVMGGLIAKNMGLPVKKFVVAVNENDEFPTFLRTAMYAKVSPSRNCLSNAMNVGHPSNLARLAMLYGGQMDEQGVIGNMPDLERIKRDIYAISISDDATKQTIREVYDTYGIVLEPHGAVAWAGLNRYVQDTFAGHATDQPCVAIETAHPAKFPEAIREILALEPNLPPSLEGLENTPEFFDTLPNDYAAFKQYVKNNYV